MRRPLAAVALMVVLAAAGGNARIASRMTTCWDRYGTQIDALGQQHRTSQALILSMAYWESGCVETAARFEPGVYRWPGVVRMAAGNETERRFLSSSYGLMQVLGATARGMGYTGTPEHFRRESLAYGVRYVAGRIRQHGNIDDALCAYNSGRPCAEAPAVTRLVYRPGILALRDRYAIPIIQAWQQQQAAEVRR